jgi:hypothetical protein
MHSELHCNGRRFGNVCCWNVCCAFLHALDLCDHTTTSPPPACPSHARRSLNGYGDVAPNRECYDAGAVETAALSNVVDNFRGITAVRRRVSDGVQARCTVLKFKGVCSWARHARVATDCMQAGTARLRLVRAWGSAQARTTV